jgi:hypothetical protein
MERSGTLKVTQREMSGIFGVASKTREIDMFPKAKKLCRLANGAAREAGK